MSKYLSSLLLLCLLTAEVHGQGIRAILGEDSARFTYITEAWGQEIGSLNVEAGVLINGTDDTLIHVGALVQHQNIDNALRVSVGGRAYYSNINNTNAVLLAFGGDFLLSPESWSGIGFGMSYFTAPSVTTFSDAEGFTEYSASIHYQITPQANIYFGYHLVNIQLSNETTDRDLEKGSFLGLMVNF